MSRIKKPIQLIELWRLEHWYSIEAAAGVPEKDGDEKEKPGWGPNVSDKLVVLKRLNVLCKEGKRYV